MLNIPTLMDAPRLSRTLHIFRKANHAAGIHQALPLASVLLGPQVHWQQPLGWLLIRSVRLVSTLLVTIVLVKVMQFNLWKLMKYECTKKAVFRTIDGTLEKLSEGKFKKKRSFN